MRWRQVVDLVIKVFAHAPDGVAIGLDGLGLQAFEFEMLDKGLVVLFKISRSAGIHTAVSLRYVADSPHRS